MVDCVLRTASRNDVADLQRLLTQLGYPMELSDVEERLQFYMTLPSLRLWVAEQQKSVVGLIALSIEPLLVRKAWRFHVEGFVVDVNHRRQGIGRALLDHVISETENYRPCVIDLTSNQRRHGAHLFYRSLGFGNEGERSSLYFRKEIGF